MKERMEVYIHNDDVFAFGIKQSLMCDKHVHVFVWQALLYFTAVFFFELFLYMFTQNLLRHSKSVLVDLMTLPFAYLDS